ncbi:uncharacterized protein LOC127582952 [Pristis pectinata]|uniref:uncharacterized protein LOC127582952 n=1 Tax=Pristis pectinata TaxID=685728 RepID=UPI00223D811B|nr:uncharacterized protein LOC127582952 [Pristis pectinata]
MPRRCLMQEYEDTALKNCPISGKAFYLDLPDNKSTKLLEGVLKKMGGTIESFLSKEVTYVISNSKEANLRSKSANLASAPNRKSLKNDQANSSHSIYFRNGQMISRGKRLLEKVIKNNECGVVNSTLANARSWGVKILHLDDLLAYFEKRGVKKLLNANRKTLGNEHSSNYVYKSNKVGKLKQPFLKIEDSSRHYKPLYHQFVNYPELNYKSRKGFSAFEHLKKSKNGCQEQEKSKLGVCRMTDSEGDLETLTKPAELHMEKKRHRFCECCRETFYDLVTHLHSKRHQDFASNPSHFTDLDDIMSRMENEFVECQSNGCIQRSTKTAASTGISLSKLYVESLQAVDNLVLEDEEQDHSLDSVAESEVINFPLKGLGQIEKMGQNSKLQDVKPDEMKEDPNFEVIKHNPLQQDYDLASINSMNRIDTHSKQLVVKLLDFNTVGKAACLKSNEQMNVINASMQEVSHDANNEGNSEICHQEKQEPMNSASEEILSCVKAFPKSQKIDCDAFTRENECSFKKRKRSNDTSSHNERSPRPRLDDLADECDFVTYFKSSNSLAGNFGEYLSQPHRELFYLSEPDKPFTSTCFEQNTFPATYSMNISIGEHFDLIPKLNSDKPLNIKEGLEDLQSKNDFKNLMNPQRVIWNCEEKPNYSNTTATDNQEVGAENQFVQTIETTSNEEEQLKLTLSSTTIQASKELPSTSLNTEDFVSQIRKVVLNNEIMLMDEAKLQNTNREINPRTAARNSVAQLATYNETSSNTPLECDTFLNSNTDSQADENGCKNSFSFCHLAFKDDIVQTHTFSSESEWDIQLPAQCDITQTITKDLSVDVELLRKTCVNMKDAEYETQLYSVLKDKSEVDWINKEGHNLMS